MIKRGVMKRATTTAAFLAAVVALFAILGAGGTYALWQDRYEVPPVTISSGSAELEILPIGGETLGPLFPGETDTMPITMENVGDVDLEVSALVDVSAYATAVLTDDPLCNLTGEASTAMLEKGASRTMCLQVTLAQNVPNEMQGQVVPVDITILGDSGAWTTDSSVSLSAQAEELQIDVDAKDGGGILVLRTPARITIENNNSVPLDFGIQIETRTNLGLLDLGLLKSAKISDQECDGVLGNLLTSLLGGGVASLGEIAPGETVYVCISSTLLSAKGEAWVTGTYSHSEWTRTANSVSFNF